MDAKWRPLRCTLRASGLAAPAGRARPASGRFGVWHGSTSPAAAPARRVAAAPALASLRAAEQSLVQCWACFRRPGRRPGCRRPRPPIASTDASPTSERWGTDREPRRGQRLRDQQSGGGTTGRSQASRLRISLWSGSIGAWSSMRVCRSLRPRRAERYRRGQGGEASRASNGGHDCESGLYLVGVATGRKRLLCMLLELVGVAPRPIPPAGAAQRTLVSGQRNGALTSQ